MRFIDSPLKDRPVLNINLLYPVITLILMLKLLYFQFESGLNKSFLLSFENLSMVISSLLFIFIVAAISVLVLKGRKAVILFFILDVLISVLLLTDINYIRYYYKPLSLFLIYNFDLEFFGAVNESIYRLFKPTDFLYFADVPFILAAIFIFPKSASQSKQLGRLRKRTAIILMSSLILLFSTASISNESKDTTPETANYTAKSAGVLAYHMEDLYAFFTQRVLPLNRLTPEEEKRLDTFIDSKKNAAASSKLRGVSAGKNLIMIQVEALQNFVVGMKVNGREVTPNLNKLASQSYYFSNFFYQVAGGNTSDAEFLSNTSMYPLKEGSVYYTYDRNTFLSLPALLNQNGYTANSFHAFNAHFWNRDNMHRNLGFDRFYSKNDFVLDEFAGWKGDALSDRSFFRQSLEKLDKKKPFYAFMITLSTHFPFNHFADYPFDTGMSKGSYISNYLKAANYFDTSLGQFLKGLEDKGLSEDTMIVLYGDHSAVPKYMSSQLFDLLGKKYSDPLWTQLQKVPLIIRLPGQSEGKTITTTSGEIDIYPTVANLLGYTPFTIGKDILNTSRGYAILRDGTVITDDYMYLASTGKLYSTGDFKELELEGRKEEIMKLQKELDISDLIIAKDVFATRQP